MANRKNNTLTVLPIAATLALALGGLVALPAAATPATIRSGLTLDVDTSANLSTEDEAWVVIPGIPNWEYWTILDVPMNAEVGQTVSWTLSRSDIRWDSGALLNDDQWARTILETSDGTALDSRFSLSGKTISFVTTREELEGEPHDDTHWRISRALRVTVLPAEDSPLGREGSSTCVTSSRGIETLKSM